MSRFAVGIDLGTTNCALAYVDLTKSRKGKAPKVEIFAVPQLVDVGELGQQPLLPSFAYLPGEHELARGATALPWDETPGYLVGEAAHRQGTRVPGRLVSSAKSWLCHGGVDRQAAILPWDADESVERISPVTASRYYLHHLRDAWNANLGADDEQCRLEKQQVVLTVPASFDEVARDLTVEAAQAAGIENFTLLEEPQAAFYHWLHEPSKASVEALQVGTTCVVIDCGGGTTDFSLIAVVEHEGKAEFERLAVGDHLLLGGDNMDIGIARHVEQQVSPKRRLDSTQWGNLVLNCRRVKERMLEVDPPETLNVTLLGRGRKLIGGTLRCDLDRATVHGLTLDGFFPTCGVDEGPASGGRVGLQEFGLPFVADPAITRHLAEFLRLHAEAIGEASGGQRTHPDAVLFNGGVFNAELCRRRVLDVMESWYGSDWKPQVLETASLDLAVAQGATYYSWARATGGRRIRSGAARSYYVGVGAGERSDVDKDESTRRSVLCVVPHGLQEGEERTIDQAPLQLQLGEPVSFPLYASSVRPHDQAGDVLEVDPGQLAQLPPLTTVLRGGRRAGSKRVDVRLETKLTEIGTLELHCATIDGQNRWKLQFQAHAPVGAEPADSSTPTSSDTVVTDTWSQADLSGAEAVLRETYSTKGSKSDPQLVVRLPKRLEQALGMPRDRWPTAALRGLWEVLQDLARGRSISVEHEWRWYNLAGFFLRPGWGDPIDAYRVEQLWKIIHQGVLAGKSERVWNEYWVMSRRIAGGLDANRQKQLASRMLPYVSTGPGGKKPPRRAGPQELDEIRRAVASLELLEPSTKTNLGAGFLALRGKKPIPRSLFWSLTRLGARVPLYGPANVVIPNATAEQWLDKLLAVSVEEPRMQSELSFAIAQIARCSGDRAREIDDSLRSRALDYLRVREAAPHWIQGVAEVTALDEAEEGRLLGDALPPGLHLAPE